MKMTGGDADLARETGIVILSCELPHADPFLAARPKQ